MIEPSTALARNVVTFLQSYPATGVEVLEAEFAASPDDMRYTIDGLIAQRFVIEREAGFYATGYWNPSEDVLKSEADALVEA